MNIAAYDRLKRHLGMNAEARTFWRAPQYAVLDEEAMVRLHSDGRPLIPGPAPSTLNRDLAADRFVDGWGVAWQLQPGNHYYDIAENPLREATVDDLNRYPWPALANPSRFAGLREQARAIQQAGFAVVATSGVQPFEMSAMLRGMDRWFLDLGCDHEFVRALMRKLTDLQGAAAEQLLAEAGDYIDVLVTGDDLGSQRAPLLSPAMYRQLIKPYHAELFAAIKARTRARIFYHSDGNIYPLLKDLIEVGIELLNPVQVSAADMCDTARLKREFGDRLSFCGAIDTQSVLPHGSVEDVREEVRRRIKEIAPGGGYIVAAVHCIQPDVPPANVWAMFDEAVVAGRYPLGL
jgi:uroporphyrinogen decarboxylase